MRRFRFTTVLLLAAPLASCGINPLVMCPDEARPMITILVLNASTGQPAAEGAGGSITDGAFSARLLRRGYNHLSPAADRPGTYTVLVQKPGYQDWTRTDVRVRGGECGTENVDLEASLVPVPPGG
jgi:hypothetical protein